MPPPASRSVIAALLLLASSCAVQQRRYMKGYFVSRANHAAPSKFKKKVVASQHFSAERQTRDVTANATESGRRDVSRNEERRTGRTVCFRPCEKNDSTRISLSGAVESCLQSSTNIADAHRSTPVKQEKGKKAEWIGIVALALTIGAWFTTGWVAPALFLAGAVLAVLSLQKMGRDPGNYTLKVLPLAALIIGIVGAALSLYAFLILVFS